MRPDFFRGINLVARGGQGQPRRTRGETVVGWLTAEPARRPESRLEGPAATLAVPREASGR